MRFSRSSAAALAAVLVAGAVHAQPYPAKPIRFIVPQAAGGSTDILSRTVGQKLSEKFGQQVVIDNRPGANGIIGTELVAKSPPDGYTLLAGGTGTIAINVSLYDKIPYDPIANFAPVALIAYSGEASLMFTGIASALAHIKAGRLRALSVNGPKRSAALPDVPTASESGLPGFEVDFWIGMLAPAGTPPAIVSRLNDEVNRIIGQDDVRERLVALGTEPTAGTAQRFAAVIKADIAKWAKAIKASGAKPE